MKCVQCEQPAEARFKWPTSQGPQEAELCGGCAAAAWAKYQNTEAFHALVIEEIAA